MKLFETIAYGLIVTIVGGILLSFFVQALAGPRDKFLSLILRKHKKGILKDEDKTLLQELKVYLTLIKSLPSFPDRITTDILLQALHEIEIKASVIKSKDLKELKARLLAYSSKVAQLNSNSSLKEKLDLLVNNSQADDLLQAIWKETE